MLAVALPLAVSAYARTSLTTLEHLLIPRGLKSAGLTADRALAGYGIVHGMALPVVLTEVVTADTVAATASLRLSVSRNS